MATTLCQMGGSCAFVLGPGGTFTQSMVPTESVQFVNQFVHLPCAGGTHAAFQSLQAGRLRRLDRCAKRTSENAE
jgi:hypothetical protein